MIRMELAPLWLRYAASDYLAEHDSTKDIVAVAWEPIETGQNPTAKVTFSNETHAVITAPQESTYQD